MATISNELPASAFVSSADIVVVPSSSRPIRLKGQSVTVLSLPTRSEIAGWRLRSLVLVQIRRTRKESVATTWLEGIAEYGAGRTDSDAISDLVSSLGEYREFLEERENRLGDSALDDLKYLRQVIERLTEAT